MQLSLSVFGAFQASWDAQPVVFATNAARALLAYLALEADRPHSRELLAELLWPDQPQAAAYANLRQTLARLRKSFPDPAHADTFLSITTRTLQFTGAASTVDAARFEQLLAACAAHAHATLAGCPDCIARLEEAAALYHGELLHGLFLSHSQPFEEWLLVRREVLHRQALDALYTLTSHYENAGDYARMRDYAARQVALEPWREQAHAQMMRALAYSGQRAAALAQYDACCRVLDQEFGAAPADETTALYNQIKADLLHPTAPPPPPQHASMPPLPVSPTPLLGRAAELAVITARLSDAACRLVTLTGPGGVGKTHLALEAARALQSAFDDGVVFVPLVAMSELDQVLPTIAHALDVHTSPDQSVFRSITNALRDKRMLLVLDNFEQVIVAAPQIGDLLAHVPHLKLLVTSRAALRLRAEHEVAVAPLPLPLPPWTATTIADAPAVALFVQRARAIAPAFTVTDANASTIVAICTQLDGLPLAIELAAARIKLLSPQQVLQRLNGRLDLLHGDMRDLPVRHQTLRNTISWSYTLLAAHEQLLFARLTVFAGGGTIDAIEAICHADSDEPSDLLDGLQSLVDNSLLRQTIGEDGVPRLSMLETIRAYGVEQLRASGEDDAMRGQHAAYYLQLAEAAAPELAGGPEQVAWFGRVAAELDNFRAALRWAMDHGDAATALRLSTALREFWMTRAYLSEGRAWLEAALALENHTSEEANAALRGRALTTAGWLAANGRDFPAAEQLFEQALALAYRTEDTQQIIAVLGDMGQAARMQGDTQRAVALYEERLALSREANDTRSIAWTLCNLGIIAHAAHDARVAALLKEGIALSQALGDQICAAWCLTFLARVAKDRGDYPQSATIFSETMALFQTVGHDDGIAFTLEGLAGLAATEGNLRAAARLFGAAEALRESINRPQPPYVRDMEAVPVAHDTPAWRAAWAEGRAMSVDQLLTLMITERSLAYQEQPAPLHNLPSQLTPFVGRERELAEIAGRLREPRARLVTLVGAGGMGKTRLALEAARAALASFADGVFFVALAPLTTATAIPAAIAEALGVQLHGSDTHQAVLRAVHDKHLLLILDNFEHLLDGAGMVSDLLQAAPQVHVLATSRERLNLRGEHLYGVEGMEYALGANQTDAAANASAVRLFVQSAQRVRPDFMVNTANASDVLRICQLVQGMPLGLELAASWIETTSLSDIAAEITASADFLETTWRDAPARQHSIRAVFDWSWALLNEDERQVFKQLSVFRGGFTREAAQTVTGASLRVLTRLAQKSLLRWRAGSGAAGRYEMHELLRQFAAEQLDDLPDERAAVEARHGAYYLRFVAAREQRLARNEPREAAAEIRGEIDNARQAWAWAAAQQQIAELGAAATSLWQFYWLTGQSLEGAEAFRLACEHARSACQDAVGDPVLRQSNQRAASMLQALHASLMIEQSTYDQALALAQEAVALGKASDGIEGETVGAFVCGQALYRKGQPREARAQMQHALHLLQSGWHNYPFSELLGITEWRLHSWLRGIHISLGDYASAKQHIAQGLRICQTSGRQHGEVQCLCNLADTARETRDYATARREYERALKLVPTSGDRWAEGVIQLEMGDVVRLQGDYRLASDLMRRALVIACEIGDQVEEIRAVAYLGRLHTYLGDYEGARGLLAQFQRMVSTLDSPEMKLEGLLPLTVFALHTGDAEQALAYAEQGVQLAWTYSHRYTQAHALVTLGHAQAASGQSDAAATYQRALDLYDAPDNQAVAAEAHAGLASIALAQGSLARAQAHAEALLALLAAHPRAGLDEPFFQYLACYHVLQAAGDPRATAVLHQARRLIAAYADAITDPALRQSFLENVPTHRELWHAAAGEPPQRAARRQRASNLS